MSTPSPPLLPPFSLFCRLEEYRSLRELVESLPQGASALAELGALFESVGLGEEAAQALVKLGDPTGAIDACVRLNHWERCVYWRCVHTKDYDGGGQYPVGLIVRRS